MFNEKYILVGGWATPLKNMKVSWDDDSQYMEKQEMFQATNQKVYIQCKKKLALLNKQRVVGVI